MTIAENTESKRTDSTNVSNINNEVLERSSLNEDSQRPEEASNSSTEGNPLLETDGKNSSVKIDVSIAKSNRTDKDEDDRASMNASRKDADDRNVIVPPDGGLRAWMVMIGSFIINGVLFSVINTYSSIYLELQRRLLESGETGASSKAALVGSLTIGTTFFLSPISGILTDKIGIQMTTFLGGAIASSGMLLSSIFSSKVTLLYLTYGVMYGLGASLAYTPSLAILGHYFKRYLGVVNGIVTAGSSVFTTLMPYLIEVILLLFGLEGTLRFLAMLTAIVMACAILFKPIPLTSVPRDQLNSKSGFKNCLKQVVNVSIWKRKRYVVWATSIPLALFGYFVPYVHIGKFVETVFKGSDKKLPIMCIGITSGIGRLVFGYIADLPKVNRILLQQISFLSIGVLTMLLPVTNSYMVLLIISLAMGLFDGCFISLLGPIAFDICGREEATQAIGFLLGMCSIPLTVGPPIAGLLYDHTGSYDIPFFLAGIPPIVGALTMFLIKFVKDEEQTTINGNTGDKTTCQNGSSGIRFLSPYLVTTLKHEQSSWKMTRSGVHSHRSSECYGFHEDTVCQDHEIGYLGRYERSESMPLLHRENQPASGRFQRMLQSSILITC
uniref:monocarboxylate transporter 10 isoform X1 n=1 Tax=Bombus vancouverensis nearcticus TaxID=2705178 RepID=UPI00143A3FC8|nr:monocarboxylate transporter 10 isoform X1 [Bombus vancouverensis nearcticus]XP_033206461.1 monocarboxylate transporter 10 isoform X1 [Bombus vancouverensis nearcticus]XP_033206462.1 monocarboxylate transporter 10 isoform X1 [Bombus vancouverensis nearcticus]XP_033206463.1 monocarboxylate transporter 10 isoform X1 [Bombus vancouverensis nearcticus]